MNEVALGGIRTHQLPAETAQGPSSHPSNTSKDSSIGEEYARAVQHSPLVFEEPEIANIDNLEAGDIVIAYVISLNGEMSNVIFSQCHGSNRLRQEHGKTAIKQWYLFIHVPCSSCALRAGVAPLK